MVKVTVSAKVNPELTKRISETGFSTSDVMLVGLEMFLSLPPDDQQTLIWDHLQRKKRERAIGKYSSRGQDE